ncbi:hypothetical protein DSO57_1012903 [Entomophthora muscae]|uniref:Uncharacterized protein n=1 Tax=Entomophthora muscae TaxID=34485 RepID=A0ACC2SIY7_9FUNG|nr:hypothetical protein DSO57_1012903 [Entomophthora muscae]
MCNFSSRESQLLSIRKCNILPRFRGEGINSKNSMQTIFFYLLGVKRQSKGLVSGSVEPRLGLAGVGTLESAIFKVRAVLGGGTHQGAPGSSGVRGEGGEMRGTYTWAARDFSSSWLLCSFLASHFEKLSHPLDLLLSCTSLLLRNAP